MNNQVFLEIRFKPNLWLKQLSINFFGDDVESFDAQGLINGHSEGIFARILLSALGGHRILLWPILID